jgi:HlyD family secretion protein
VNVLSVPINAVTTREKEDSTKKGLHERTDADVKAEAPSLDNRDVIVFVKDSSDRVRKVKVKTAIQDINYIEVTEGLKGDEIVIYYPYDVVSVKLKEKDKVKVVGKKEFFDTK